MPSLAQAIQTTKAYYCLECGKCSAVCPLARFDGDLLPRRLVEEAITAGFDAALAQRLLWACLTCKRCTEICPSDVDFIGFVRELRVLARGRGSYAHCTHGDAIFGWMRVMANRELKQDRLAWVSDDIRVSASSDVVYFVGCLPYYDAFFGAPRPVGLGARAESGEKDEGNIPRFTEIARSTVKLLNQVGIEPKLLAEERCCGHDLLWAGDVEGFEKLARLNAELIRGSGAKLVVTSCPECYRTLAVDYPRYGFNLGIPVMHITQFLAQKLEAGEWKPPQLRGKVTYHDPCRLGRLMGVYEEPRALIRAAGLELVEMEHNRSTALCCGTSCWIECGYVSREVQRQRLEEARDTDAELMLTACHKCEIHFECFQAAEADRLARIRNLITLLAQGSKTFSS